MEVLKVGLLPIFDMLQFSGLVQYMYTCMYISLSLAVKFLVTYNINLSTSHISCSYYVPP